MRFALLILLAALPLFPIHAIQCHELLTSVPLAPTTAEVQQMLTLSRTEKMNREFPITYQEFFVRILSQPENTFAQLTPKRSIEYLSLFAQWRLIPPTQWVDSLIHTIEGQIPHWGSKNFLAFAQQRKLTPLVFPQLFLASYHEALQSQFVNWDANTQLEVLSAELYHGNPWQTADLTWLLKSATETLKKSEQLKIKPLKEMYRALLFLPLQDRKALQESIQNLITELEVQMQGLGFSLKEGGRSYSQNPETGSASFQQSSFAMDLMALYPGTRLRYDYENPELPGFFDPVDMFIKEQKLVIEWDGPQHYFRRIYDGGRFGDEASDLVLRTSDQSRDRVLRAHGYRVLRISPALWSFIDAINILALIDEQNP